MAHPEQGEYDQLNDGLALLEERLLRNGSKVMICLRDVTVVSHFQTISICVMRHKDKWGLFWAWEEPKDSISKENLHFASWKEANLFVKASIARASRFLFDLQDGQIAIRHKEVTEAIGEIKKTLQERTNEQ